MMELTSIHIDRRSKVPYDKQLYKSIVRNILMKRFEDAIAFLPHPTELATHLGIPHPLVMETYERLIQETWIQRINDTYQIDKTAFYSDFFTSLKSLDQAIVDIGRKPNIDVLHAGIKSLDMTMVSALKQGLNDAHYIRRVIYADTYPLVVYDNYLDASFFDPKWDQTVPLYQFLRKKDIHLSLKKRYIETIHADTQIADLLHIPVGTAIFKMYGAAYDQHETLVQITIGYVHPNFVVTLES